MQAHETEPIGKIHRTRNCTILVMGVAALGNNRNGMAWHGMAWHGIALHCIALHCITLHYIIYFETKLKHVIEAFCLTTTVSHR
jgi:hypothetical protein